MKRAVLAAVLAVLAATGGHAMEKKIEKATFGAGCFWGVEKVFAEMDGVVSTAVGYTGGTRRNPTYEEICTGRTGHAEAVQIEYDPEKVSYTELLEVFWTHHNPTTLNRQANDVGTQYRSAVFYHDDAQRREAERTKRLLDEAKVFHSEIVTEVTSASEFWRAEDYHQKYLKKTPNGYCNLQLQSAQVSRALKGAAPSSPQKS